MSDVEEARLICGNQFQDESLVIRLKEKDTIMSWRVPNPPLVRLEDVQDSASWHICLSEISVENGTDNFLEKPSSVAMIRYLSFCQDRVTDLVSGPLWLWQRPDRLDPQRDMEAARPAGNASTFQLIICILKGCVD